MIQRVTNKYVYVHTLFNILIPNIEAKSRKEIVTDIILNILSRFQSS